MDVRPCGDAMILIELDPVVDAGVNAQAIAIADELRRTLGPGLRDVVPAYCSVGVHFDPLLTDHVALERAVADVVARLPRSEPATRRAPIEIPVRYGGADGPDLEAVAAWAGLTVAEVVARHTAREYRVYMLGFVPGFAYMGKVDASIAAPRHRAPRERVPAGSVGIAGEQTGVYPIETPGGWQLIGRTDLRMFDTARAEAALAKPGDTVRFVVAPGSAVS
ncbi:MAG: 5-oxoprolinase subunit PxpB [Acidobacteriota bacterium]